MLGHSLGDLQSGGLHGIDFQGVPHQGGLQGGPPEGGSNQPWALLRRSPRRLLNEGGLIPTLGYNTDHCLSAGTTRYPVLYLDDYQGGFGEYHGMQKAERDQLMGEVVRLCLIIWNS